jgi:hypothetical protein
MDRYAENEKKIAELHEKLVNDIRETLKEKGYKSGDTVRGSDTFNIMGDRLLINGYHTDWIDVENLLKHLRAAYHVIPKN